MLLVTLALTEPEVGSLRALDVPVCTVGPMLKASRASTSTMSVAPPWPCATSPTSVTGGLRSSRGNPNEPENFTVPPQRRAGYHAALEAAGIAVDPDLEAHGAFTVEGGEEATVQLLGRRKLPTAIFTEV